MVHHQGKNCQLTLFLNPNRSGLYLGSYSDSGTSKTAYTVTYMVVWTSYVTVKLCAFLLADSQTLNAKHFDRCGTCFPDTEVKWGFWHGDTMCVICDAWSREEGHWCAWVCGGLQAEAGSMGSLADRLVTLLQWWSTARTVMQKSDTSCMIHHFFFLFLFHFASCICHLFRIKLVT